ncbi:metal-dependent hydrolase [Cellulomonas sp. JZ18]|uniref:metal-dependent hydrolase n=1 Tax=Cellulomonas sp. JZ18 TaxID=2654191 RepID=UPI001E28C67D|nr:metal-dependent hydrolase [Cellulomonas sp. JZ18]
MGAGQVTITTERLGELALGAGVLSLLLVAFAARALGLARRRLDAWALALALAAFVTVAAPTEWDWLPVAVGLGAAVHVAGDMLTGSGVPLLWPWEPRPPRWWRRTPVLNDVWTAGGNLALPLLGTTGSWRERLLVAPLTAYAAYGVGAAVVGGSLTALGYDADRVLERVWEAAGALVTTATVVGAVTLRAPLPG